MEDHKKRKTSSFLKGAAATGILLLLSLMIVFSRSVVKRVRYELNGSEVTWEDTAAEREITSDVEEYYYDHLPEELHEPYREIYVHLMQYEDSGEFMSAVSVEDFWNVYYAVLADHPEIFWTDISAQVQESTLSNRVVSYQFDVTVPADERDGMRQELEAAADACIAQIPEDASDYERIKFVFEYIIDTTEYDLYSADSQNIQSVLLYHSSVCAGYSRAFQYILHRMGMFCTYITGTIIDGGDHGWNMVRIGDNYYYVDVTWGDPLFAGSMSDFDTEDTINYNYLCCPEWDLFKTHIPGDSIELPECLSDDYDYYKLNGYYYETFDTDTISAALLDSVHNGESRIMMKFGSEEAFETAIEAIFENGMISGAGQYLMNLYDVQTWNYRYHTDSNFNLITIYWF